MGRTLALGLLMLAMLATVPQVSAQKMLPDLKEGSTCSAADAAKTDGINWEPDLATAMAKATKEDKPVLIVFLCRFLGNCNSPHA